MKQVSLLAFFNPYLTPEMKFKKMKKLYFIFDWLYLFFVSLPFGIVMTVPDLYSVLRSPLSKCIFPNRIKKIYNKTISLFYIVLFNNICFCLPYHCCPSHLRYFFKTWIDLYVATTFAFVPRVRDIFYIILYTKC